MGINCVGYEALTVSSTALGLASIPARAKGVTLVLETDAIRWTADGTTPTSSVGILLKDGGVLTFDSWSYPGENWRAVLKALKFIRVTNDASLKIAYFD